MRKLLIILVALMILSLCIMSLFRQKPASKIQSVKHTLHILRSHGFFEKYKSLSDEELYDSLHKERITYYTKMFEHHYDPGMELDENAVLMLDSDRAITGDMESDVGKGNNQYVSLLKDFAIASGGLFMPTNINEIWDSEEGPIHVSFVNQGSKVSFQPIYHDDWLSEDVFDIINTQMRKVGTEKFWRYLGKDGGGLGQYFLYVRMTESQKTKLEESFGWKFSN